MDTLGHDSNVLDAFSGIGGNAIQFAKKCGFCVAADIDLQKIEYAHHNSQIYQVKEQDQIQLVHSDFLKLTQHMAMPLYKFPDNRKQAFDCVFISPPWGGVGYQQLEEYSLKHIYPEIDRILMKALSFSGNLMLFLPRNTSIEEIIDRCLYYHDAFTDHPNMLAIELEQLYYGDSCKVLLVSTGQLAKIQPSEVVSAFIDQCCLSQNAKM